MIIISYKKIECALFICPCTGLQSSIMCWCPLWCCKKKQKTKTSPGCVPSLCPPSISSSSLFDRCSTINTPTQSPRTLTVELQRSLKDTSKRSADTCFFTLCWLLLVVVVCAKAQVKLTKSILMQTKGKRPSQESQPLPKWREWWMLLWMSILWWTPLLSHCGGNTEVITDWSDWADCWRHNSSTVYLFLCTRS